MSNTIKEEFSNSNFGIFYQVLKRCKEQGLDVTSSIDPDTLAVKCIKASAGTIVEFEKIAETVNGILITVNVFLPH